MKVLLIIFSTLISFNLFSQRIDCNNANEFNFYQIYDELIIPDKYNVEEAEAIGRCLAKKDSSLNIQKILIYHRPKDNSCLKCLYHKFGFETFEFAPNDILFENVEALMEAYNLVMKSMLSDVEKGELKDFIFSSDLKFNPYLIGRNDVSLTKISDELFGIRIKPETLERIFGDDIKYLKFELGFTNSDSLLELLLIMKSVKGVELNAGSHSPDFLFINYNFEDIPNKYSICWCEILEQKNRFVISLRNPTTATDVLSKTIESIDTIKTVSYKQDMYRTNPRDVNDTIFRYREMYFERLVSDSIVGVKGHWFFYSADRENVVYEDIYDGDRLIRKNNLDSLAMVYDLIKYPEFKKHFWSHNTPFALQFMFKFILENEDVYQLKLLNDTSIKNKDCYQIAIILKDKSTMPGFAIQLEESEGGVSQTLLFINKQNYYPVSMIEEFYSVDDKEQKVFMDQKYYDIKFNIEMDSENLFNTSDESLDGYEITDKKTE